MPFSLSPSVDILEKDLTLFTKAIVSNSGAFAGAFQWGPAEERTYITNGKEELAQTFGKPDDDTYESFWSAANFMAYKLPLYVARVVGASAVNAVPTAEVPFLIKNQDDYDVATTTGIALIAKYPGTMGNSIVVETCPASQFGSWIYKDNFEFAPEGSEYNVVIVDSTGAFTGAAGTVMETFDLLTETPGSTKPDGTSAYYKDVLNQSSKYVWVGDTTVSPFNSSAVVTTNFQGGVDDNQGVDPTNGFNLFANPDDVDIAFIVSGACTATVAGTVMDIATTRKDCFAFVSPLSTDVVANAGNELTDVLAYRNTETNRNTSYGVMDCNWKYMYDSYNNVNRWVPCNPDTAGLLGRVYLQNEPWESPAGYNRGQILGAIKLAWNPNKAQRDELYKAQVNPIISAKGEGHLLLGDKTQLTRPSAFGYINVRSLFIILERSIADAAKYQLFELNTAATRSQFKNQTNQFLRNIQGRGGIIKYLVIADDTNNTEQVINAGQFVGQIAIKPPRSINNIILEFNAIGLDVQFEELEQRAA